MHHFKASLALKSIQLTLIPRLLMFFPLNFSQQDKSYGESENKKPKEIYRLDKLFKNALLLNFLLPLLPGPV